VALNHRYGNLSPVQGKRVPPQKGGKKKRDRGEAKRPHPNLLFQYVVGKPALNGLDRRSGLKEGGGGEEEEGKEKKAETSNSTSTKEKKGCQV